MNMFWNMKANNFVQSISIGYGVSLVASLVFQNVLLCVAIPNITPLTYIIYVTDVLCIFTRAYLGSVSFKTFNTMQLLFTMVLTFVCFVLTVIVMITQPPWVDIVLGVIFILALAFHFYLLWKIFARLTKIR